jgi:N-acetylglucosaminyldiphosphoundecaprenol N-acetyl-beta-D-mannosaminyltransferase
MEQPAFRDSLLRSGLSTIDGTVLWWLARLLDVPLPERVTGADLFLRLQDTPPQGEPLRVFLFGGPDGVAHQARSRVNARSQGLEVVGSLSPGFGSIAELGRPECLQAINQAKPEFLVLSLGAIRAHEWIELHGQALRPCVVAHLGAVVNYEAGTVRRAPRWLQVTGLEWLWRTSQEPSLWRRYWRDGWRLVQLLVRRVLPHRWFLWRHRARLITSGGDPHLVRSEEPDGGVRLALKGAWHDGQCAPLRTALHEACAAGQAVTVDLAEATYVDSAVLGLLLLLHGHQGSVRRELRVVDASPTVRRLFHFHGAEFLLQRPAPSAPSVPTVRETVVAAVSPAAKPGVVSRAKQG